MHCFSEYGIKRAINLIIFSIMVINSDELQRWEDAKLKMAVFLIVALLLTMVWLISRYCGIQQVTTGFALMCGLGWIVYGFAGAYFAFSAKPEYPMFWTSTLVFVGVVALDMTVRLILGWFGLGYSYHLTIGYCLANVVLLTGGLAEIVRKLS